MAPNRRKFISQSILATAAGLLPAGTPLFGKPSSRPRPVSDSSPTVKSSVEPLKFSVIGLNHGHIYGQSEALIRNGAQMVSFYAKEPELIAAFTKRYPNAKLARSENEILEDKNTKL